MFPLWFRLWGKYSLFSSVKMEKLVTYIFGSLVFIYSVVRFLSSEPVSSKLDAKMSKVNWIGPKVTQSLFCRKCEGRTFDRKDKNLLENSIRLARLLLKLKCFDYFAMVYPNGLSLQRCHWSQLESNRTKEQIPPVSLEGEHTRQVVWHYQDYQLIKDKHYTKEYTKEKSRKKW